MSWLGDIVGGLFSWIGGNSAAEKQKDAANYAAQQTMKAVAPYQVSTPIGRTQIKGKGASVVLSPRSAGLFNKAYSRANAFNPTGFSNSLFQQWNNMMEPEFRQALEDAQSSLWGLGKLGTTSGNEAYAKVFEDINQMKSAYALDSIMKAQNMWDSLLKDYYVTGGAADPYLLTGAQLAGNTTSAGTSAGQWLYSAGLNNADATAAFWSTLGSGIGAGINYGVDRLFGGNAQTSYSPFSSNNPSYINDFNNFGLFG